MSSLIPQCRERQGRLQKPTLTASVLQRSARASAGSAAPEGSQFCPPLLEEGHSNCARVWSGAKSETADHLNAGGAQKIRRQQVHGALATGSKLVNFPLCSTSILSFITGPVSAGGSALKRFSLKKLSTKLSAA